MGTLFDCSTDNISLIEVKDFISFVAVRASVVKTLLANIRDEKMKGKKYKIECENRKFFIEPYLSRP